MAKKTPDTYAKAKKVIADNAQKVGKTVAREIGLSRMQNMNIVKTLRLETAERQMIILLSIGVLIFANLIVSPLVYRIDLSKGQAYSLSNSTKELLRSLDDRLTITFYASNDLPTQILIVKNEVRAFLNEYDTIGGNNVVVEVKDPSNNEQIDSEARERGLQELQFSQTAQDEFLNIVSFFGISIQYGDKTEVIPQATQVENLEYDISTAIYKTTRDQVPQVGIIGAQTMPPVMAEPMLGQQGDTIGEIRQLLRQQFNVNDVSLTSANSDAPTDGSIANEETASEEVASISATNKAVLIFDDGQKQYSEAEVGAIREYIADGGDVLFFVDRFWGLDQMVPSPANHNLFPLLEEYGIQINADLVMSPPPMAEIIMRRPNEFSPFVYPLWLRTDNFNTDITYFSNVGLLTFPWVSSITKVDANDSDVRDVVYSIEQSWRQTTESPMVSPDEIEEIVVPDRNELQQQLLIAESTHKERGTVMVVPSSRFVMSRFLSQTSQNIPFILNVVNNYASDGKLAGIQSRSVNSYPIKPIPESVRDMFKYSAILLFPILFGVYGALRLTRRAQTKEVA